MKKVVKGLVIAASVAAVAGLGAVSFAKWEGSSNTSKTATGATGIVNTIGDIVVTPTENTGSITSLNALVPWDQGDGVTYWEFDLSCSTTGEQSVTYTILGSIAKGTDGTELGDAELRWHTSAPSAGTDGSEISGTAADITGSKVFVFLVAGNTDAMKADISLTFAIKEAQA